ncbi:MAG: FkbM family methyltransferase, partial [Paracoccaceae bacterium]
MFCRLPNFLIVYECPSLIRLGRDNDGGYLISEIDVKNSNCLISLGICDDWSFERDYYLSTRKMLRAYDESTGLKLFYEQFIRSIKYWRNIQTTIITILKPFDYIWFFRGKKKHFRNFISDKNRGNEISFESIMNDADCDNILLKIDIEGAEYKILNQLIEHKSKICGMVIEFHDIPNNLEQIKNFIANFDLPVVHVHANNFAPVDINGSAPVMELTFSRNGATEDETKLFPNQLDMPNNEFETEITLLPHLPR